MKKIKTNNLNFKIVSIIFIIILSILLFSIYVYSSTVTGVKILGNLSDGCVSDDYCLVNLTCINNVCLANYTINLTIVNSTLQSIPALIEIWEGLNLIYSTNDTNSSYDLFYTKKYNISIKSNYSNCSEILVKNILNEDDSIILFGISDVQLNHTTEIFEQICSVNPFINDFDNFDLTIMHSLGFGRAVYKCANWNFTEMICNDEIWEKIKIIENNVNKTTIQGLNHSDPGFGIKSCCGDGVCDINEDISICPNDCGGTEQEDKEIGGHSGILYLPQIPILTILEIDLIQQDNVIEILKENQDFIILHPQGNIKGYVESLTPTKVTIKLEKDDLIKTIILQINQKTIDIALNASLIIPYLKLGYFEFNEKENNFEKDEAKIYFENIFSDDYKRKEYIPYIEDKEKEIRYPFDFYLTKEDILLVLLLGALFFAYPLFIKKNCLRCEKDD